ncbi:MAG: hypothetical protein F6K63_31835 [Moorea sp. SIO1G6]|uniref:hypothetical protein n=1 Tax=Moorena sp. SIO1G6 TaxID=2607840 RepID=UPI0013BF6115|nr:hypothetical protein [Moorena sp. SIO1G6]NET68739.1 hypothetical protein [Moorena sp. SIO1G6]
MPVLLLQSLARCQFYFDNHWQDASSTLTITGKMPVLLLQSLARCQFYFDNH